MWSLALVHQCQSLRLSFRSLAGHVSVMAHPTHMQAHCQNGPGIERQEHPFASALRQP